VAADEAWPTEQERARWRRMLAEHVRVLAEREAREADVRKRTLEERHRRDRAAARVAMYRAEERAKKTELLDLRLDRERERQAKRKRTVEEGPTPTRKSKRGRRDVAVSVIEATKAAKIYVEDPEEFDARDDGGAYAVHKLYVEDRDAAPLLLSRPMVGHLIAAIREGRLSWDARRKQLRISDEFRTKKGMFRIPRDKPA
jgi:hypothetical protein